MNLQERIRAALAACDPLGLIEQGCPVDEYDNEADDLFNMTHEDMGHNELELMCREVFEHWFDSDMCKKIDFNEMVAYLEGAYGENKFIPDGVKVLFFPHLEEHRRKYGNCSVHVVKEIGWDQRDPGETPRMFEVIFPDGETGQAFEEELVTKTWSYNGDKSY